MGVFEFFSDYLRLFLGELLGVFQPRRPGAPDPATAQNADTNIISYRDDVPMHVYLGGGLAVSAVFFLVWAIIGYAQHHAAGPLIFIWLVLLGWPLSFTWMHMCLTGRYPELPYIWCDAQMLSIDQRCSIAWKRVVTIKPILRTHRDGRPYTAGVTLEYIEADGLETLSIRSPRASSGMKTICEDLRERAMAAGAVLYPLDHAIA